METKNPLYNVCLCCLDEKFISLKSSLQCNAEPFHFICDSCFTKSKAIKCFYCYPLDNKINIEYDYDIILDDENFAENNFCKFFFVILNYIFLFFVFSILIFLFWLAI